MNSHFVPGMWKVTIVRPLFKNTGSSQDPTNYRPISNICTIAKIFEKVLLNFIENIVSNKLSNKQYGFTKNTSTITNLIECYSIVYTELDKKNPVDIITIDFAKAFDKVDISLLFRKLLEYGVSDGLSRTIFEYLSNRSQKVAVGNQTSEEIYIKSGVPQGSILSPILFKIFIDDLLQHKFENKLFAYADDIKIVGRPGKSLQDDLDYISNWALTNSMVLNTFKCETLHLGTNNEKLNYYLCGQAVPTVSYIKDLGIVFDEHLKFAYHISRIQTKCLRLIGLIFRIFARREPDLYINFYQTYILPVVDYGSFVFYGTSNTVDKNIEKIQRIFTRRLFRRVHKTTIVPPYMDTLFLQSRKFEKQIY